MSNEISNEITAPNWKTRTYVMGAVIGALFGLASAFLYSRAAEEEAARGGKPTDIRRQP